MLPSSLVRRRSVLRLTALAVVGASVAAACSSGESALEIDSGEEATSTVAPDETTGATTDDTADATSPDDTSLASTTTVAPLAEFPDCPTGALDSATGPIEITFWHGMNDVLEDSLIELTDAYNASQDKVRVTLQNQTGYDAAIDKYIQSSPESRPDIDPVPRVHAADVRPVRHDDPDRCLHRGQRIRHLAVPRSGARRLHVRRACSGRCRST